MAVGVMWWGWSDVAICKCELNPWKCVPTIDFIIIRSCKKIKFKNKILIVLYSRVYNLRSHGLSVCNDMDDCLIICFRDQEV